MRFSTYDGTTSWVIQHSHSDQEIKIAFTEECDVADRRDFRILFPRLTEFFNQYEMYEDFVGTIPESFR
jgi:hypothetical protein